MWVARPHSRYRRPTASANAHAPEGTSWGLRATRSFTSI
ncbi:hypothetical protein STAFG_4589 [Streptomyces afghaniensis 772]|uniref:Uncharacterized protein n=1 Tax=Streptomyces afghaniensis 772 TaxID=1283301 RepID=S4MFU1_9ACTN|nr:hypothetical protein STAFG_4589 [Streptomyces afghaniensis 772]